MLSPAIGERPTLIAQEQMVLIRALEDELQALCLVGEAGDLHFS